ncbi:MULTISPECIES: TetR/AcrR family transcriptional regulator [unclassified Beijerinckia]|uniref:TetR/AcrR family transcriptional regulator n=1 Tax=unclassified Beijerinckia TaxID=2638183 RepID=UPI00089D9E3A|nr:MULTISPECIES: TetR/AcrR family transcriptional regulator [unclassified Beijerinckia]MDH7799502.1 AcrR family transcriptional regulator [Beijerinckia sp. GAS462]SED52662.1 transcriptional regulator, TetR family [Beijerinckia sp. 28-YEA-48]
MADTIDTAKAPPADKKQRIIAALMALAGEMPWEEITISEVALRAGISLADFRDQFPSKGAVLAGFSRMIDRKVLDGTTEDLAAETARDRLFDVLMRRIDAMAPYKAGLKGISQWVRRDPVSAMALNTTALNSMRFMLEAAHLHSEGLAGTVKLQGLVIAWQRVLAVWFEDDESGLDRTMAVLDRELSRGETLTARLDDMTRLTAPLRSLANAVLAGRPRPKTRTPDHSDDVTPV